MADDMMDKTINSILTAFIAVILVASMMLPTLVPIITDLGKTKIGDVAAYSGYVSLLEVVLTITIVGIIIGVIKMYTSRDSDREGRR